MQMPTRVALIGAGRMGQVHLQALATVADAEVTAVVDPVAAGASYADVSELLAAGPVEAAIVAAPSSEHLRITSELLEAGVPTLCEKPCGTTTDEAATALHMASQLDTPLQVGYWRRFVPALRGLRERIQGGTFGEVLLIRSQQWDQRPPPPAFRASSGGILIDMGVHEFDQIRWLTGQEVDCRAAVAAQIGVDPPVEGDPESVEVTLALSGGGLAVVSLGRCFPPGDMCRVDLVGTGGVSECPFLWPPESERTFLDAIARQDAAFIELVRGREGDSASAADAVAALETAEQALAVLTSEEARL
jgi:myo-inositol 2-dehydrogenase / D-chiro-inositol 1-dehydrogenase